MFAIACIPLALANFVKRHWLWSRMSLAYPGKGSVGAEISEGSYRWVSLRAFWFRYGVAVEIYPAGLWLRLAFPENLLKEPVLIPWSAISAQEGSFFGFSDTSLHIAGFKERLKIRGRPGRDIVARAAAADKNV